MNTGSFIDFFSLVNLEVFYIIRVFKNFINF
jgi:hypothetical protein